MTIHGEVLQYFLILCKKAFNLVIYCIFYIHIFHINRMQNKKHSSLRTRLEFTY